MFLLGLSNSSISVRVWHFKHICQGLAFQAYLLGFSISSKSDGTPQDSVLEPQDVKTLGPETRFGRRAGQRDAAEVAAGPRLPLQQQPVQRGRRSAAGAGQGADRAHPLSLLAACQLAKHGGGRNISSRARGLAGVAFYLSGCVKR